MKILAQLSTLFFLVTFHLNAQSGIVRGTITDADFQDPVPFANILVKAIEVYTVVQMLLITLEL
jgi:hypothetical protein